MLTDDGSLPDALRPLARLLDEPAPRVVVVVGTGISYGATGVEHATWPGLLRHAIDHLVRVERLTPKFAEDLKADLAKAFDPFDLEKVFRHAQAVEGPLKGLGDEYAQWLASAFSTLKARRTEALEAIRELHDAGALILTTNYDSLVSDLTGSPAVTWQQPAEFNRVALGEQPGILHLHGHWSQPDSVVLGPESYRRITGDSRIQFLMRSLWREKSWVYVGCGAGLDDPNLGTLLDWSRDWEGSSLPDYLLTLGAPAAGVRRPGNIVHFDYGSHDNLPDILSRIAPSRRARPFVRIDENFKFYRAAGSTTSVPSQEEYRRGLVPAVDADDVVSQQLDRFGWSMVEGPPSAGKTTLAVRLATAHIEQGGDAHFLDLGDDLVDGEGLVPAALERLARPGSMIILDNVHRAPELANDLWDLFVGLRGERGRLLMLATRLAADAVVAPDADLSRLRRHRQNPAVVLTPSPSDFRSVAHHLFSRMTGKDMPPPPPETVAQWRQVFGGQLHVFCLAVLESVPRLRRGEWTLSRENALGWVRANWLKELNAEELANIRCLAAFGSQELELTVPRRDLPFPAATGDARNLGITASIRRGDWDHLSLVEPGWGELILDASIPPVDRDPILIEVAARSPFLATILSHRLIRANNRKLLQGLWGAIERDQETFAGKILDLPVGWIQGLENAARLSSPTMHAALWKAIETDRGKFAARALETQFHFVAAFMETAKRQGRDVGLLWAAIEADPEKVAERAWDTPIHLVATYMETAKRQGRDVARLWEALEADPEKFGDWALKSQLHFVATFMETAKRHGRAVAPLWTAIEADAGKLVERAWDTPLHLVATYMETAKRQGRDVDALWAAIEAQPDRLAELARFSPLSDLAAFMETAKRQGRDVGQLWTAIEAEPDKLAERAWDTPLSDLAAYTETAKRHGRDVAPLWSAIEAEPRKLAERAWDAPLHLVAAFMEAAKRQGRDVGPLWSAIEAEPGKLVERVWGMPLTDLAAYLETAKRHGRDVAPLWTAIEAEPKKLAARAWTIPPSDLAAFMETARRHERDVGPLWEAIDAEPGTLTVSSDSLHGLAAFFRAASEPVGRRAVAQLDATQILAAYQNSLSPGAVWVAMACARFGRTDIAEALTAEIVKQKRPAEFLATTPSSLFLIAWVLSNAPEPVRHLTTELVSTICTELWLSDLYKKTEFAGALANGLEQLAGQPMETRKAFFHTAAVSRVVSELMYFAAGDPAKQVQALRLVGMVNLFGWHFPVRTLSAIDAASLAELPAAALPHRPNNPGVERQQRQLWFGLRAYTSLTRRTVPVNREIIAETLRRWETVRDEPGPSRLRVLDEAMCEWLGQSAKSGAAGLVAASSLSLPR